MTIRREERLASYVTLRAGGPAERLAIARSADDLTLCLREEVIPTIIGWGSNVLPSDAGVRGLVILNLARRIDVEGETVVAESGAGFQDLFLKAAQAGLGGLEFAVGIPGTVGGALVSNAGAYRSEIGRFVTRLQVADGDEARWVGPEWMEFSYRDSRLRSGARRREAIVRVELKLPTCDPARVYALARENQRQRIGKQPPGASAGSFFKNVIDPGLAQKVPNLTVGMRENGVVPAGVLIEECGLKGARIGGAMIGRRHANFLLNVAGATATELRSLALYAYQTVRARFGVELEEEVMYIGDWSGFRPLTMADRPTAE